MDRIECIVSGKVQGVFFRANTVNASRNFEVTGFVKNLDSEEVLIIAEGEKTQLELFLLAVKNFSFTKITKVKVKWKKFKNEFKEFKVEY